MTFKPGFGIAVAIGGTNGYISTYRVSKAGINTFKRNSSLFLHRCHRERVKRAWRARVVTKFSDGIASLGLAMTKSC